MYNNIVQTVALDNGVKMPILVYADRSRLRCSEEGNKITKQPIYMARIFITGSADGLGQLAAKALIAQGHQVVLHARNEKRGKEALDKAPGAETVVTATFQV